jgi:hypothetical protein
MLPGTRENRTGDNRSAGGTVEHNDYLKRRDELLSIRMDSFTSFDKAVLSLATGSLALSMTFLEKIGKPFDLLTFRLILLAWVAFFIVIILNLCSYLFARANMDRKIKELDSRYQRELDTGQEDKSREAVFWHNRATRACNTGALLAFGIGVLFFMMYVMKIQAKNYGDLQSNVAEKENNMANEERQNLGEGKTEAPRAISSRTPSNAPSTGKVITHGATEAPQAVLRPVTPSTEVPSQVPQGKGAEAGTNPQK